MGGHPLADRLHDRPLQLLGSALLKAEMAEVLVSLDRASEVPGCLDELRSAVEEACHELRGIMAELRRLPPDRPDALNNRVA